MLKIAVFYDGNLFQQISSYFYYTSKIKKRISLSGFHILIEDIVYDYGPEGRVVAGEYYKYRLSAADAAGTERVLYNERVFDDILMDNNINSNYLPIRIHGNGKNTESGLHVMLSLDAMQYAIEKKADVIVLVVNDPEYISLVRKLCLYCPTVIVLGTDLETGHHNIRTATDLKLNATGYHDIIERIKKICDGNRNENDTLILSKLFPAIWVESSEKRESVILTLRDHFGFIKWGANNLYFHERDYSGDFDQLNVGDPVSFSISHNTSGEEIAVEVKGKIQY